MTASWMEALVANIFPKITSVQALDNVTRCTAQSSGHSSHLSSHNFKFLFLCSDIDHNDNYYHDPYSDMPRLSLVDKARVIGQIQAGYTKKWNVEFVSGVDQENVLLAQHAVQAWTPLDMYGTSWGELFVPESPSPPCRISVRLWYMSEMLYHSSAVQRLIFSMRRRYEAVFCGIWWFHPILLL